MTGSTRRQRRETELAARREQRRGSRGARRSASSPPAWRSPMALLTAGALLVGLVVIGFAVLSRPPAPSDELVAPIYQAPAALADGRALGAVDAPVVVEIWSDFQCPACKRFAEVVEPALVRDVVEPGTARLEYRDMAFLGRPSGYDESVEAAAAGRCAADQGRFWPFHAWIFANWNGENQGAFRTERLRQMAQDAGLDLAEYDSCMASGQQQAAARAETSAGASQGINSTPSVIINGEVYRGQLDAAAITAAIRAAAGGGG